MGTFFRALLRPVYAVHLMLVPERYNEKIFCIGFNKTGTTSCGRALRMLGYRHSSFSRTVKDWYKKNEIVKILRYTAKFESFDDVPWLHEKMIPILDTAFPGSKFIYLTREEAAWKKSVYNWTFKMTGRYPDAEEKLRQFRAHKAFVLNYFQDRPSSDFLILDVSGENAFQQLADFLGKKAGQSAFPHLNKTGQVRSGS